MRRSDALVQTRASEAEVDGVARRAGAGLIVGPGAASGSAGVRPASRGWRAAAGLGVAVTALVAAHLTVGSLGWPLVHDGPLMQYVAARILAGAVPYRDLFDMNLPGVYLVHAAGLVLLGGSDAAFRAFDLSLLALTVAGLAVALRPYGGGAALGGGALFWLYHVAGGAWRAGQRDLILCVALAWMTAAALAASERRRADILALAGLCLGLAVWVKPYAVVLLPLLAGLARRMPSPARALAGLGVAAVAPGAAILGWLARAGGLPAFLDIVFGYLVPLYSRVGRVSLVAALREQYWGVPLLAALVAWAAAGAVVLVRTRAAGSRSGILLAGVAYGAFHYAIQGKGWEYHLYPLALFLVAAGAAGLGAALRRGCEPAVAVLLLTLAASVWVLSEKGWANQAPEWVTRKEARVRDLVAALGPVVAGGGSVQVLDTTDGGIDALYRLGAREPTRFLYDFHFYHDVEQPYVRRLRAELLAGLRARPPAAVVLFERGWPAGGYERLDRFPALRDWLTGGYVVAREGDGYRLYRPAR